MNPPRLLSRLTVTASLLVCVPAYAGGAAPVDDGSVFKVRAVTAAGVRFEGSAVLVASGELVTNCHVIRDAERIELARDGSAWPAQFRGGDPEQDLCLLASPDIGAPSAIPGSATTLSTGDAVYAVGFPAGDTQPGTSPGRVESVYEFQGSWVIQTSAAFSPGASGGALFDDSGRLVGILTFRAPGGGKFHFAVPVDWIAAVRGATALHGVPARGSAFWERNPDELPRFLRATWFEAKKRWPELFDECLRWAAQNPGSDEPNRLMVRAVEHLLSLTRTTATDSVPDTGRPGN